MENSLTHYGILGMKWGVRREVGSDGRVGSLKIYRKGKPKEMVSPDYKDKMELKKIKPSKLSNKQLETLNKRMRLESDFKNLKKKDITKGQIMKQRFMNKFGEKFVDQLFDQKRRQVGDGIGWSKILLAAGTAAVFGGESKKDK